MASVFEVEHPTLGVHLALKVFDEKGEHAEFLRSRLLAEGRVLARLEHPNLVKVHDCGVDEATGVAYITMDLVLSADGEPRTLSDLHAKHEIDEELLFRWYADIASALAYIHSRGIVHRDVKPSNILIAADGRAVLADFGVSRFCDEGLRQELSVEPTMVTDASSAKVILGAMNLLDTYDPAWKAIFAAVVDAKWGVACRKAAECRVLNESALPEQHREIWRLVTDEGMKVKDVAKRLGIPANTVSKTKRRIEALIAAMQKMYV